MFEDFRSPDLLEEPKDGKIKENAMFFLNSKVNMKSTLCHDFRSPDLLEEPKDGKIKENAMFFLILKSSNKVH